MRVFGLKFSHKIDASYLPVFLYNQVEHYSEAGNPEETSVAWSKTRDEKNTATLSDERDYHDGDGASSEEEEEEGEEQSEEYSDTGDSNREKIILLDVPDSEKFTLSPYYKPRAQVEVIVTVPLEVLQEPSNHADYVYFFYDQNQQTIYLLSPYAYFKSHNKTPIYQMSRNDFNDFLQKGERLTPIFNGSWFWGTIASALAGAIWQGLRITLHQVGNEYETFGLFAYPLVIPSIVGLFYWWRQKKFSSPLMSGLLPETQSHLVAQNTIIFLFEMAISIALWEVGVEVIGYRVLGLDSSVSSDPVTLLELGALGGVFSAAGFVLAVLFLKWIRESEVQQDWVTQIKLVGAVATMGFTCFLLSIMSMPDSLLYIDSLGDQGNDVLSVILTLGAACVFFALACPLEFRHSIYSSPMNAPSFFGQRMPAKSNLEHLRAPRLSISQPPEQQSKIFGTSLGDFVQGQGDSSNSLSNSPSFSW